MRLDDDPLAWQPPFHMFISNEAADRQIQGNLGESVQPAVNKQGCRECRAGCTGTLIAAMEDARPRNTVQAVFADPVISEERAREANQSVVVQGHDSWNLTIQGSQNGRGESWEEVMTVNNVGASAMQTPAHLFNSLSRPQQVHSCLE
jgi:hypothetical protein